jgi:hypothetical protein
MIPPSDFEKEFIVSLVTALVIAAMTGLYVWVKARSITAIKHFGILVRFAERWQLAGISNFFRTRADYTKYRTEPSASAYIKTTKTSLSYVGFWLAEAAEIDEITESFRILLHTGKSIKVVILDPNSAADILSCYSRFFNLNLSVLRDRVNAVFNQLVLFRNALEPSQRIRFHLNSHREFTGASAFLFDENTDHAKALVDFKFFAKPRELTFGMELKPNGEQGCLYDRVKESFSHIEANSHTVP